MTDSYLHPKDRWFDDYEVGDSYHSERTYVMREQRMIQFAEEFDPQAFHTDPEAATESVFGGLIASGWHTTAAMMSLIAENVGEASMGAVGIDELRWPSPVRPGDELRLTATVVEMRPSTSKPDRGIIRMQQQLHNQRDELVFSCIALMMFRRR